MMMRSEFLTDDLPCLEAILSRALGGAGACGSRLQGRLSVQLFQATALSASADREEPYRKLLASDLVPGQEGNQ